MRKTLTNEQETEKRIKALEADRVKLQKQNQLEVRTLLAEAKKTSQQIKDDFLTEADSKGKKLIIEAQKRIEQEQAKAQDELRLQAARLAKEMVVKLLEDSHDDPKWQEKEIESSLKKLKTVKTER